MTRKHKYAIKLNQEGVVTGYQSVSTDRAPEGFDEVVEVEDGILVGGPELTPAYRFKEGKFLEGQGRSPP